MSQPALNTIKVELAQQILKNLSDNNYSLCLSHSVYDEKGTNQENVVAISLPPKGDTAYSMYNTFKWDVAYSMSASQQAWSDGGEVDPRSGIKPLELREGYRLISWSDEPQIFPQNYGDTLRFEVVQNDAAPIVFLRGRNEVLNGRMKREFTVPMPIYVGKYKLLHPGGATLIPKRTAVVYFMQGRIDSGGMISEGDMYLSQSIDLTSKPTGQIMQLGNDSRWTIIS